MHQPLRHHSRFRREIAWISLGCVLVAGCLWAPSSVWAQQASDGALALGNPRSSAFSLSSPRGEGSTGQRDREEPEDDPSPMNAVGLGVRLGVAVTGAGSATVQGYEGRTDRRVGLHLSVPLYLGGDGFGWVFEPMLQRSSVTRSTKDAVGNVTGAEDVNVLGLGGFTGPLVQIQASDSLYVGIGLGLKFLYLSNDDFAYAYDLYGRVPLSLSYYVSRHCALSVEAGLGWGASVFADPVQASVSLGNNAASVRNVNDDPEFGTAFAWDLSFGVRVP